MAVDIILQHVSRLKDREEELKKIRDGEFPPVKKRSGEAKGKGRKQMWRELMSLVLPFKRIELQVSIFPVLSGLPLSSYY